MITALLGRPGSGKSYEAVRWVRQELKKGRVVITTLPLVMDAGFWKPYIAEGSLVVYPYRGEAGVYGSDPSHWDEWRESHHQREIDGVLTGPLVVLDECVFIWSELGPKDNTKNPKWAHVEQVIATHRHSAIDFLWVAQTHLQMPTEVKKQVEEWIELTNLAKVGVKKGYSWASYTTWYPPRERLDGGMRIYSQEIFGLYDTHALGSAAGSRGGERKRFFSQRPIWTRGFFWMGVAAAGLCIYVAPAAYDLVAKWGSGDWQSGAPQAKAATSELDSDKRRKGPPPKTEPVRDPRPEPVEAEPEEEGGLPAEDVPLMRITGRRVVWAGGRSMSWDELTFVGVFVLERRPCLLRVRRIGVGSVTWRCSRGGPAEEQSSVVPGQ